MGLFELLRGNPEPRAEPRNTEIEGGSDLASALLSDISMTPEKAMNIPSFAACVNLIAGTVSMIPFYLYERSKNVVTKLDDSRARLINNETGDMLTGTQFKRALVTDYLTDKGGYAYLNRQANGSLESIHYVPASRIYAMHNTDTIFKSCNFIVDGNQYAEYKFLRILRNSKNGWSGTPISTDARELLLAAYYGQLLQKTLAQTGGNKKGFLKSQKKLTQEAIDALKTAWKRLYSNTSENVVILNDGLDFAESSATGAEMQLNESLSRIGESIREVMGVPSGMFKNPTAADKKTYIQFCILPILKEIECSLNRDLLTSSEKENRYFAADLDELTRGDLAERYEAYNLGLRGGFLQIDEVRADENREPLGLPYVRCGLQDVWYDPASKTFYNPNMNVSGSLEDAQTAGENGTDGGDNDDES